MKRYIIENKYQKITILNYGATIYQWHAFSDMRNIVISNVRLDDYLNPDNAFMGATIGRVANRIGDAKFKLNGITYYLDKNFYPASGHGGNESFFRQKFEVVTHEKELLKLKYFSKHLESNYPGNVSFYVTYQLKDNELDIVYEATTDQDTLLNITNHSYFNLSNEPNILNHKLKATSSKMLDTDKDLVPTGKITDNTNTVLDFNKERVLKEIIFDKSVLDKVDGLDHFFLFDSKKKAEIVLSYKNKSLIINTTYPGFQAYSFQKRVYQPLLNRTYEKYIGITFEPHIEPDSINHPSFNTIVLKAGEKYYHTISYKLLENGE